MTTTDERSNIEKLVTIAEVQRHMIWCRRLLHATPSLPCDCTTGEVLELAKRVEEELDALRMVIGEVVGKDHSELSVKLSTAEAERDAAREDAHELGLSIEFVADQRDTLRARVEELEARQRLCSEVCTRDELPPPDTGEEEKP